jgi:hypothetical protein
MPLDPDSFDEIKLPFIYIPHGEPEPTEWLQRHPDYIKMPATYVPRARSGGRASPSPPTSPPGQHRTIDGLAVSPGGFAASPDQAAPWPPSGNARFDGMSDAPTEAAHRLLIGADPIEAYCRTNETLATAASRYVLEPTVASNPSADVGNRPADPTAPSGSLAERVGSAIWHSIISPAEANEPPNLNMEIKRALREETPGEGIEEMLETGIGSTDQAPGWLASCRQLFHNRLGRVS